MHILNLIDQLQKNSSVMPEVEQEINRISNYISLIAEMSNSINNSSTKNQIYTFYLFKAVELRLKKFLTNNLSVEQLQEIVTFIESYLQTHLINHNSNLNNAINTYSQCALYAWPTHCPKFTLFLENAPNDVMLVCLHTFLVDVNYSSDISNKRRAELKKLINIYLSSNLNLLNINNSISNTIDNKLIDCYTELLKINYKLINYDIIFNNITSNNATNVISFVVECDMKWYNTDLLLNNLNKLHCDINLMELLLNSSTPLLLNDNTMKYFYDCMEEEFTTSVSYFISVLYKSNTVNENILMRVLERVFTLNNTNNNENEPDNTNIIFQLIHLLVKTHSNTILFFISTHENMVDKKYVNSILCRIVKNNSALLTNITFSDIYNQTYLLYLINTKITPEIENNIISILNTNNNSIGKLEVKLIVHAIEKYKKSISEVKLSEIYNLSLLRCNNSVNNNNSNTNSSKTNLYEVLAIIDNLFNRRISFEFNTNKDSTIKYYYYLKHNSEYIKYSEEYVSYVMKDSGNILQDRCYAVLCKIILSFNSNSNNFLFEYIYKAIENISDTNELLTNLMYLNNDLLVSYIKSNTKSLTNTQIVTAFLEKELNVYINTWDSITDHSLYYNSINSYIGMIECILNNNISNSNNLNNILLILTNLLYVDYAPVSSKIISNINRIVSSPVSNTERNSVSRLMEIDNNALNNLMSNLLNLYTMPHMITVASSIVGVITVLLVKNPNSKMMLSNLLNKDISAVNLSNLEKKTATNTVKNIIKEYRGKSMSKMYQRERKAGEIFIMRKEEKKESEVDLKDI